MKSNAKITVIIPAYNEEKSIDKVIQAIPEWIDEIIVVDNGSTDNTGSVARDNGARVVQEPKRGYGTACLTGIAAIQTSDIVVFLDGDFSDYPGDMHLLVDPILSGEAEMVIGSRLLGITEPGSLALQARFGNMLACFLIKKIWKVKFTDLGPFRAIRYSTLLELGMRDPNYGWTVEMQIRAAQQNIPSLEVPVRYRKGIGKSKVSGTIPGVIGAATTLLGTIFWAALFTKSFNRKTKEFDTKKQ